MWRGGGGGVGGGGGAGGGGGGGGGVWGGGGGAGGLWVWGGGAGGGGEVAAGGVQCLVGGQQDVKDRRVAERDGGHVDIDVAGAGCDEQIEMISQCVDGREIDLTADVETGSSTGVRGEQAGRFGQVRHR